MLQYIEWWFIMHKHCVWHKHLNTYLNQIKMYDIRRRHGQQEGAIYMLSTQEYIYISYSLNIFRENVVTV